MLWFSDTRAPHGLLLNILSIVSMHQAKWCRRRPSSTNMQGLILQNFQERFPQLRFQCLGILISLHTLMYTWSLSYTNKWNSIPHSKHDSLRLHLLSLQLLLQCEDACRGGLPVCQVAVKISVIMSWYQVIIELWMDGNDALLFLAKVHEQFANTLSCYNGCWDFIIASNAVA